MNRIKIIRWEFVKSRPTPMGVAGGNYVYYVGDSYFSYNENPNNNIIDKMFGIDTGEETAFYDAKEDEFVILLGDFRNEISKRKIDTRKKAIGFCKEKYPEYGSPILTTHKGFN
jgi:hypothetical protein